MTEDDREAYQEMQVTLFGLIDPCDWAAELNEKLARSATQLNIARLSYENPARDVSDEIDAQLLANIRSETTNYLAQIYEMLSSMPAVQQQPVILGAVHFVIAGILDTGRGAQPAWLGSVSTKRHPKRLQLENEWVPFIAALELLKFDPRFKNTHLAAKEIANRTARPLGTIKDWHAKLFGSGAKQRPAAELNIRSEINQMKAVLFALGDNGGEVVEKRVNALLRI